MPWPCEVQYASIKELLRAYYINTCVFSHWFINLWKSSLHYYFLGCALQRLETRVFTPFKLVQLCSVFCFCVVKGPSARWLRRTLMPGIVVSVTGNIIPASGMETMPYAFVIMRTLRCFPADGLCCNHRGMYSTHSVWHQRFSICHTFMCIYKRLTT